MRFEKFIRYEALFSAGVVFGIIVGFLTLKYVSDDFLITFLVLTSLGGGILGLVTAKFFDKKKSLEGWFQPANRSKDLDNLYRAQENKKPDLQLIDLIKSFTDSELITAMRLRYYDLTDRTETELIKEIKNRKITTETILKHFEEIKFYKFNNTRYCPCCGNSKYVYRVAGKVTKCVVCGFNREIENPDSVATKIRWSLGVHSAIKLRNKDFLRLIN